MTTNAFLKKYGAYVTLVTALIQIIFTIFWWFMTSGVKELRDEVLTSLREIKSQTQKLSKHLEIPLAGGMTVKAGVNPKEISENLLIVYSDNSIGLKPGDTVQLSNFTDNTFQASLKFIVQKSIPRPSVNASSASIFMSEIAAKRIGFEHYKREGVIDLKLIRFDDFQPKRLDNDINTTK